MLRTDEPLVIRELVSKMIAQAVLLRVDWRERFKHRSNNDPVSYMDIAWEIRRLSDKFPADAFKSVWFLYSRGGRGGVVIDSLFPPCRFCRKSPYQHIEFQCRFEATMYAPMTVEEASRIPHEEWGRNWHGG